MEEIDLDEYQLNLKFSSPKVKYTKSSRYKCRKTYDGKVLSEELTYRCTSCGKFKNPDKDSRCENCIEQLELL